MINTLAIMSKSIVTVPSSFGEKSPAQIRFFSTCKTLQLSASEPDLSRQRVVTNPEMISFLINKISQFLTFFLNCYYNNIAELVTRHIRRYQISFLIEERTIYFIASLIPQKMHVKDITYWENSLKLRYYGQNIFAASFSISCLLVFTAVQRDKL